MSQNHQNEAPQLLEVSDAAARLSIHPDTLRIMLRKGQIEGVKIGRVWRVSAQALSAYIARNTIFAKEGTEREA